MTCLPTTKEHTEDKPKKHSPSIRNTDGYVCPSTRRAESELKMKLQEEDAIDLYEAPPNNDLSTETTNQRNVRRSRMKKNLARRKEGKEALANENQR